MVTKKNFKFLVLTLLTFLIVFTSSYVFAYDYESSPYIYPYEIDKYHIKLVVNENNTFGITEEITANFFSARHGIFRTIPMRNEIERLDGSISKNKAQIYNINVDDEFKIIKEDGNYKLQIGSNDTLITGTKKYKIEYTYNIGKDPLKDVDELYYNLIGDEWDTTIKNISFEIIMPKDFDKSKLGFSYGPKGSTNSEYVHYSVDGNIITGQLFWTLEPREALTVRCELPEGYFVGAGLKYELKDVLLYLIPFTSLLIAIYLWYRHGKEDFVASTVEFYPPEDFNSLEVGFLYKGYADKKDVTSLLVYLANQGYIEIEQLDEKNLFSASESFKITKLRNYDGNKSSERLFLSGLFSKDNLVEVTKDDLEFRFYTTMNKILKATNKQNNKEKILEKGNKKFTITTIILMFISFLSFVTIATIDYGELFFIIFTIILCLFYTPFYLVGFSSGIPAIVRTFWLGFTFLHSAIFFSSMPVGLAIRSDISYLQAFIFNIICFVGMGICCKYMPKRTEYGAKILAQIKGFKEFLETAEKDKLESMVFQDPTYFYSILPFAYVLEVSDKWIKKFETIATEPPDWYISHDTFTTANFGSFMSSTMKSAQTAMSMGSSASGSSSGSSFSSGSSGSSGGGSSGGGSGGGGGGSW